MLDHWLDEYEALWQGAAEPPSITGFLARLPVDDPTTVCRELALIDLEQRWRHFFPLTSTSTQPIAGIPRLPLWIDYCHLLPECDMTWIEGILHEFRVRQLFGDRPHYRHAMIPYPAVAAELTRQLPDVAATATRAIVTVFEHGRPCYSCRLPGRLEIGRQRADEPKPPGMIPGSASQRLLIADLRVTYISRRQCELEVVAKDRIVVQNTATKGDVRLGTGQRLRGNESLELALPFTLTLYNRLVRIERE